MKLFDGTGVTEKALTVEKPIYKLGIDVNKVIANETVTVRAISATTGRVRTVYNKAKVLTLLKMFAFDEGSILLDSSATPRTRGNISLTKLGRAIQLANDESISIEFANLDSTGTYKIYGHEAPENSTEALKLEIFQIESDKTTRQLGVNAAHRIAFTNNVDEVIVSFKNGSTVILTKAELELEMQDNNDIESLDLLGNVVTQSNLFVMNIENVNTLEFSKAAGAVTDIYLLSSTTL